ncbi:MAG: hypothetical protein J6L76_06785 [Clostridia bacterium]|nr:hypothetical protein [Clostridia bacterium]
MKRVIAFTIALAICVGLYVPFATSTQTRATETPTISFDSEAMVDSTEITVGQSLTVYIGNTEGAYHGGKVVYSVRIVNKAGSVVDKGGNVSSGSDFTMKQYTFENLAAGTYTVQLRLWDSRITDGSDQNSTLDEIQVTVKKAHPTISVECTELSVGAPLIVSIGNTAGVTGFGVAQYSVRILKGGTVVKTEVISNSQGFKVEQVTFENLAAGTYTVQLRIWDSEITDGSDQNSTLQEITVTVKKAHPTISAESTELTVGDSLVVSIGNTAGVTGFGVAQYSVRILKGGTVVKTEVISNSQGFKMEQVTFENLSAGTYTVQLRIWDSEITDGSDQNSTLQEITVTINDKPLTMSVSTETLKAGESVTFSYEGLVDDLLTSTDVYSIWFGTASGTKLNEWNIWDTSTSLGESNSFTVYVKSAGTYVVRLRVWNAVSGNLDILQEYTITVEKAVQLGGSIQAGKTEYIAGEVQYFSYTFADAADITNIGHRSIKIYNGSTLVFEWTSRNSANSGSSSNEWIDLKNASLAGKPGTYTMKVVIYGTDTLYPGYEDMTYTYTVVERTEGTTPNQPTVTVPRQTLISGEQIAVSFDGMSIANLDYNTRYRVAVRNASGTLLDSWVLWDCGNTYEGLYGVKYSQALPIGNYTVALETRPNSSGDYAAIDTIEILVKKAALAAQPELKESITMHYTVMLGADVTGTPVMTYVYNGEEIVVEGSLVGDNAYMFALEGILPQDMGKTIDAYVSIDGTEITRYEGYSVRQYCLNQLEKTDDANLKALLVALLNYGTQAQGYFGSADAAINDGLDQSLLTDYLAGKGYDASNPAGNVAAPVNGSNDGDYVWKAATLGLYDTIKIRVKFQATSVDSLKVVAGGKEYTEFVSAGTNLWYVYIPVYAADFAEPLTITFQDSTGIVGATLTYSVNTYIKYAMDNGAAEVKPLVEAIYYYGVLASERA